MSNSLCRSSDSLGDALGPAWPERNCVYPPQTSDPGIEGSFWMGRDTVWWLLQCPGRKGHMAAVLLNSDSAWVLSISGTGQRANHSCVSDRLGKAHDPIP